MLDGPVGLVFFSLFALINATTILKLKKPHQIFLAASIVSAPWQGGVWLGSLSLDLRLTYIFMFAAIATMGQKKVKWPKKHKITFMITVPVFLMFGWATVSALQAYNMNIALGGIIILIFNFLYMTTIIKAMQGYEDFDWIIKSLCLGLLYPCIIALIQYKFRFFHIGFIDGKFTTFMFWRTRSLFLHANQFGMYQLILLPIIFRQIMIALQRKDKNMMRLMSGLFFLSMFTLYTTGNRGSWVGFAFGMITVFGIDLFRRGNKKTKKILTRVLSGILVVLVIASAKYGQRIIDRFEGRGQISAEKQAEHRKDLDVDAYRVLAQYPMTGVGIRNFQYYATIIFTHNLYLLIPSEIGYPGLVFFLWFILGFLIQGRKAMKHDFYLISNMGSGLLATLFGLLLASQPGPDFWISNQVSSALWIVVGIVVSLNRLAHLTPKTKKRRLRRRPLSPPQNIPVEHLKNAPAYN